MDCRLVGILLIEPLGTNFIDIFIEIQTFSLMNLYLKVSSAKVAAILSRPQWESYGISTVIAMVKKNYHNKTSVLQSVHDHVIFQVRGCWRGTPEALSRMQRNVPCRPPPSPVWAARGLTLRSRLPDVPPAIPHRFWTTSFWGARKRPLWRCLEFATAIFIYCTRLWHCVSKANIGPRFGTNLHHWL